MFKIFYAALLILIPSSLLLVEPINAANLNVKPGKWKFRIITSKEDQNNSSIETKTRCFEESSFDPFFEFNKNHKRIGCSIRNVQSDQGKSVRWNWSCIPTKNNPATTGKGMYNSTGSTIDGFLVTISNRNGIRKTTDIDIKGKYVGKCTKKDDILVSKANN